MDRNTKELALDMLEAKAQGEQVTYAQIANRTGYGERQLMRLARQLAKEGRQAALGHGNAGRRPANAAGKGEVEFIRRLKEPYKLITIAQLRDIYLEDVVYNPARRDEVEEYGLTPRSATWFRELFVREGWRSPAQRPARACEGRVSHPVRDPMPRAGMLAQIDATPYDWFGDGRCWALHLAVDDATTDSLAGWFMPSECMRGYARMMAIVAVSRGVPECIYSDRHSVFTSPKGGLTQFGRMMEDLHVRMVFAKTPQAKGRVERYNRTAQLRLVNDIIRFGIKDYDQLNVWFNESYVPYLNSKLSFPPADPRSAFAPLPDGFNLSSVFRTRGTRVAHGGRISISDELWYMVDVNGEFYDPGEGVEVDVHIDALTDEMYVERGGKRYACASAGGRRRGPVGVSNQRELQQVLEHLRRPA